MMFFVESSALQALDSEHVKPIQKRFPSNILGEKYIQYWDLWTGSMPHGLWYFLVQYPPYLNVQFQAQKQ